MNSDFDNLNIQKISNFSQTDFKLEIIPDKLNLSYICDICQTVFKNNVNHNCIQSENMFKQKNKEIQILKQNIKYRDIEINCYKSLIESQLGIKLSENIFDSDITIYSEFNTKYKKNKQSISKQSNSKQSISKQSISKQSISKQSNSKIIPNENNKKQITRKKNIPKSISFIKEKTPEDIIYMIENIDKKYLSENKSPNNKLWILTKQEHLNKIDELIKNLETNRNYSKVISEIKTHRLHLLRYINEDEYSKHIHNHTNQIKKIFHQREFNEKKINRLVRHKFIGAYEYRMLFMENFEKTTIDHGDVELVKKCF